MDSSDIIAGAIIAGLIIAIFAIFVIISGWATTYLAHTVLGTPYITDWGTRFWIGIAMMLSFGGNLIATVIKTGRDD